MAVATFETFDELLLNFTVIDDHNFALIEFSSVYYFLSLELEGLDELLEVVFPDELPDLVLLDFELLPLEPLDDDLEPVFCFVELLLVEELPLEFVVVLVELPELFLLLLEPEDFWELLEPEDFWELLEPEDFLELLELEDFWELLELEDFWELLELEDFCVLLELEDFWVLLELEGFCVLLELEGLLDELLLCLLLDELLEDDVPSFLVLEVLLEDDGCSLDEGVYFVIDMELTLLFLFTMDVTLKCSEPACPSFLMMVRFAVNSTVVLCSSSLCSRFVIL